MPCFRYQQGMPTFLPTSTAAADRAPAWGGTGGDGAAAGGLTAAMWGNDKPGQKIEGQQGGGSGCLGSERRLWGRIGLSVVAP